MSQKKNCNKYMLEHLLYPYTSNKKNLKNFHVRFVDIFYLCDINTPRVILDAFIFFSFFLFEIVTIPFYGALALADVF